MEAAERLISRTLNIKAERQSVFRALLDPSSLSRWLFAAVNLVPETGTSFSFEWRDSARPATAQGEILELIQGERLVLSWFMEADGVTTTAAFDLSDGEEGSTILRFTHSGLPQDPEWAPRFRAVALEWDKVLLNLRFLVEEKGEGKHLFFLRSETRLSTVPPRACHAWTTTTGLSAWLARDVRVIPEEGQMLEGTTLDTGKPLSARFERIEADHHLRFTWSEGGVRGILGVSFWPAPEGTVMLITLRSFALLELERPFVEKLWAGRFEKLAAYLARAPRPALTAGSSDAFTVRRELEAAPGRVWNALVDASLLRRWFATWTDFDPRVEASFVFLWTGFGEVLGRIREVHLGESVLFTWDSPELPEVTGVRIAVRPDTAQPGLCTVEITHEGWGDSEASRAFRAAHEAGWTNVLALLDFYLRHGAGREKREVQLLRHPQRAGAFPEFSAVEGWRMLGAAEAEVPGGPGGALRLRMEDGTELRGRLLTQHPSGAGSAEFDAPWPAFLEWSVTPEGERARVLMTLTSYDAPAGELQSLRARWGEALDRIS